MRFPCGTASKESAHNEGELCSIPPGLGRSPGEGEGYPLQYPGLENSMDCIVSGVTKSQTWLSDIHFHFSQNVIEICMQVKKQQLELDMEQRLVPNWERSMSRLYVVTLLI